MKEFRFIIILLLFFVLFSCSNMFEHEAANNEAGNAKYLTVSGTLSAEFDSSAVPRSAFPANDIDFTSCITNFYYKKNKADTTGTFCGTSEGRDFVLKLPALGTYYIDAVTTSNDEISTYKTSEPVQITLTEADPCFSNLKIGVYLVMDDSSTAKGSVRLPIQIFDISKVQKMEVYENGQRIAELAFSDASYSSGERILDWTIGDLTKGVHEYTFKFYSDQACTNLVYQFTEKVTIFPGMETNTWVNNGNAEYIGRSRVDVIYITQDCLDNFALTNFYVSSESGNDDNNGSYFAPLKTIEKALEKCRNSTKECTINLNGTFSPTNTLNISKKVKIQKAEGARNAVIIRPAGHTTSMINVISGAVCTISGVTIDGNKAPVADNGAGICNAGTLTLKNCVVKNCVTSGDKYGGGIYTNGSLTITGGVIGDSSKYERPTSTSYSNCSVSGGAIFIAAGGSCTLGGDAIVSYNYSTSGGGGLYNVSSYTSVIKDSVEIKLCASTNYGGGVYTNMGKIVFKDNAKITNCSSSYGGGVSIGNGANFEMQSGSISGCSADNGGGVYIELSGSQFNMSGGTISGCSADREFGNGNGVYVSGTYISMSGSACISGNDVYLYPTNTATINITGALTTAGTVAVITPCGSKYTELTQVLSGNADLLKTYKGKFKVTDNSYNNDYGYLVNDSYSINDDGKIYYTSSTM